MGAASWGWMMYRFRVDEGKLVLQVYDPPKIGGTYYYEREREGTWRDASVADIPVTDPFQRERVQPERYTCLGACQPISGPCE
jgi:hypothetical protein